MKINKSIDYALVAVGYIAENHQDGPVSVARVSKEYGIPLPYLLRILQPLVRANVLKSKRGQGGGFSLARDSKEITMLQIIEVAGGPLMRPMHLAEQANNANFSIKMEGICKKATEKEMKIYDKAKFSDML